MLTWTPITHVTVGICTYRRPSLSQTLESVAGQRQLEGVELSVLVVDNDESGYARNIVESFSSMHSMTVLYEIEARKNIATARNRCLQSASTDWLAFIDDDEIAEPSWLARLIEVAVEHRAHAIFGQVVPVYAADSPSWIRRGDPFARLKPARGSRLETGSTANVLCHLHNTARPNEQRLPPATGTEGRTDLCGSLHGRQERCHSWGERGFLLVEGDRVLCRFHCSPDHRVQTCDKLLSAILPEHGKGIFCTDASGRRQPLLGRVDDGTSGAQQRSGMDRLLER
jgi:glycosyltransferase involved in cell wall biosynthesis